MPLAMKRQSRSAVSKVLNDLENDMTAARLQATL